MPHTHAAMLVIRPVGIAHRGRSGWLRDVEIESPARGPGYQSPRVHTAGHDHASKAGQPGGAERVRVGLARAGERVVADGLRGPTQPRRTLSEVGAACGAIRKRREAVTKGSWPTVPGCGRGPASSAIPIRSIPVRRHHRDGHVVRGRIPITIGRLVVAEEDQHEPLVAVGLDYESIPAACRGNRRIGPPSLGVAGDDHRLLFATSAIPSDRPFPIPGQPPIACVGLQGAGWTRWILPSAAAVSPAVLRR